MNPQLLNLAQRRARLVAEIGQQRAELGGRLATARQSLAYAGIGLLATQLLARRPWLRVLALAGLVIAAGSRLAAHRGPSGRR